MPNMHLGEPKFPPICLRFWSGRRPHNYFLALILAYKLFEIVISLLFRWLLMNYEDILNRAPPQKSFVTYMYVIFFLACARTRLSSSSESKTQPLGRGVKKSSQGMGEKKVWIFNVLTVISLCPERHTLIHRQPRITFICALSIFKPSKVLSNIQSNWLSRKGVRKLKASVQRKVTDFFKLMIQLSCFKNNKVILVRDYDN